MRKKAVAATARMASSAGGAAGRRRGTNGHASSGVEGAQRSPTRIGERRLGQGPRRVMGDAVDSAKTAMKIRTMDYVPSCSWF